MGLRDIGETLPPGFRFYPSDEELVCHYLYRKVCKKDDVRTATLVDIDLHTCEPWQLPDVAKLNSNEWYFFSIRDRKYATGHRTNRATTSGYWKATGKDRTVWDPKTRGIVGMRKTLVFYKNRAPNGIKTEWVMHEFRMENPNLRLKEDWVLCRVFNKSRSVEDNHKNTQHINNNNINITTTTNNNYNISPNLAALSPSDDHAIINHDNEHQLVSSFYYSSSQYQLLNEPGQSTSLGLSKIISGNNMSHCEPETSRDHGNDRNKLAESKSCDDDNDFGFLFDMFQ